MATTAACRPNARVSNVSSGWTVAAGPGGGAFIEGARPQDGRILATDTKASQCLTEQQIRERLGPECDHESESKPIAGSAVEGDLAVGLVEQADEVRWYCDERLVVRLVLSPCDLDHDGKPDGLTPREVAVNPHRAPEK